MSHSDPIEQTPAPQGDEKTASDTITRGGEELSLIEEFASDTLGALDIETRWFVLADGWDVEGNTATADVQLYEEDGTIAPDQLRATLTLERAEQTAGGQARSARAALAAAISAWPVQTRDMVSRDQVRQWLEGFTADYLAHLDDQG